MTTELVDHLPASDSVPTPLAFLGRTVGTPGELTYAKDIARYYRALAAASPRARFFTIGTSEEGRDIVMLAIADEETIASLDAYRGRLGALTDPRRTTDAEANRLVKSAKPVYWITGGMHSPETGGPETLIELAYRLIVEDTPFVRRIRANVITLITPVLEVDGREKQVDTYYFNKRRAPGDVRLPLVYWGRYVAHDNNRDGIGQYPRADAGRHEHDAGLASDGRARPPRDAGVPLRVHRHRSVQPRARSDRRRTSGGRWPTTTCAR